MRGVMDLAGPLDMTVNIPGYEAICEDSVITSLLGGTPANVPERYSQASAITLLPLRSRSLYVAAGQGGHSVAH